MKGRRIDNPNTHGTGCTLSSAIASNLAKGMDMDLAVERAKVYLSGALEAQLDLGKGSGPMNHGFCYPGRVLRGNEHEGKDKYKGKRDLRDLPTALYGLGAGVSIAEILTGTYLAPLGFGKGLAAIVLGHVDWLRPAVHGRTHRRLYQAQLHGNREDELWAERKPAVLRTQCPCSWWAGPPS